MLKNILVSLIFLNQSELTLTCLEAQFDQSVLLLGLHRLLTRDNASCLIVFKVALGESTGCVVCRTMHDLCS